jgi:hypothetical protein
LPQRSLEPLQTTHKPLFEALAVTVRVSSWFGLMFFSSSCNHVLWDFLSVCVW